VSADQKADLSFTVDPADLRAAAEALGDLGISERVETDERVGKVSIVGAGMRSHPGVAAKVFQTLGENGINIEMISTSPIKISCVIAADRVPDAVRGLHQAFELGEEAVRPEDPTGDHRPIVEPGEDDDANDARDAA
jgi:aspartate kinase